MERSPRIFGGLALLLALACSPSAAPRAEAGVQLRSEHEGGPDGGSYFAKTQLASDELCAPEVDSTSQKEDIAQLEGFGDIASTAEDRGRGAVPSWDSQSWDNQPWYIQYWGPAPPPPAENAPPPPLGRPQPVSALAPEPPAPPRSRPSESEQGPLSSPAQTAGVVSVAAMFVMLVSVGALSTATRPGK